jgi:FkbM family methyltransferase
MTLDEAIELAIDNVEKGHFAEAESIYLQILQQMPNNKIVRHLRREVQGAVEAAQVGTKGEQKLLEFFKKNATHYPCVPEYNLNWSLKNLAPVKHFLQRNPISVVDVGAREGFLGEIEDIKNFVKFLGFDADVEECERLNKNPPNGFNSFRVAPYFIGKNNEEVTFNLYKSPGESSVYAPNREFQRKFNRNFGVRQSLRLNSIALQDALEGEGVFEVDFLKLDTQGSELDILRSSENLIKDIFLIESEIEITEMYDGQPLIGEFLSYMSDLQFEVMYINRVFANRQDYSGPARGQVTFCDVLFAKRDSLILNAYPEKIAKHLVLLCAYGHLDVAHNIWNMNEKVKELVPNLDAYFVPYPSQGERLYEMSRDKRLCWQLHQRKTNQLSNDSDRSWPFR